jgi:hypothetical protein
LYCFDDGPGDLGSIAGGWILSLTTETGTAGASIATPRFVAGETPPRINSMILSGQDISITVSGEAGVTYVLESSSDLVNWSEVATLENQAGTLVFHDQLIANATRFYRAVHARATNER